MQHAASAITAPDTGQLPAYWQFHEAVTRAQLTEWLPTGRHLLVDVSGPRAPAAELAAKAGHTVLPNTGHGVELLVASRIDTVKARKAAERGIPVVDYPTFPPLPERPATAATSREKPPKGQSLG